MTNTTDTATPADLIAALGADRPGTLRDVLTDYARRLTEAGVFDGLTPRDARLAAAAITVDATPPDDPDAVTCARQLAAIILDNL